MTPPVPRIKVCGVTRLSDVEMLVAAGVDAIGINWVPSSPRYVSPAQAKVLCELAGQLGLLRVAVLMDPTPRELQSVVEQGQYEFLQFHGMETPDLLLGLQIPRSTVSVSSKGQAVVGPLNLQEPGDSLMPLASTKDLPGEQAGQTPRACLQPGIIKAIAWSGRTEEAQLAAAWQAYLHAPPLANAYPLRAFLVDAYAPGQGGGSGKTVHWGLLQPRPPQLVGVPLILAGGLKPSNLAEAIVAARPDGVDTASGVEESPGIKSTGLVEQFAGVARANLPPQSWTSGE